MSDAALALLGAARTILGRAAMELDQGEAKQRICMALASVNDAIEEREDELERFERTKRSLEVLADALTTPGIGAGE